MNKCDHAIYGCDENTMALSIAADALGAPSEYADCGSPSQADAVAVGSKGKRTDIDQSDFPNAKEPNPSVVILSNKSDSRARTRGNHGSQD